MYLEISNPSPFKESTRSAMKITSYLYKYVALFHAKLPLYDEILVNKINV